jgi:hypothetical protein
MFKTTLSMLFILLTITIFVRAGSDVTLTLQPADGNSPTAINLDNGNLGSIIVGPEGSIEISLNNTPVALYNPIDDTFIIEGDLDVNNIDLEDDQFLEIVYDGTNQWKQYAYEDFQGVTTGWNNTAMSSCGTSNNKFLGGYCNFGATAVSKTWSGLPKHSQIRVTFNYHFIDEWTGQAGYAKIDGKYVWQMAYTWCDSVLPWYCQKFGINACGAEYPDKLAQFVQADTIHSADSLTLIVSSTLTQDACQASWGIDDVSIYII